MSSSVAQSSSTGAGYWYNGVWYPTNIPNIGGGENVDASSNAYVGISHSNWDPNMATINGNGVQTCSYNGQSIYNCHY